MKKFLAVFFTLLIAGAAVLFIWHFTDHFNGSFKTFYLVYDGENIMSSETEIELQDRVEETVQVKYPFDTKKRDYTIAIMPNTDIDLQYIVGTSIKRWNGNEDVEKLFEIKKEESSFTIKPLFHAEDGIEEILALLYPGEVVEILNIPPDAETPLFVLTVTSYNAKIQYTLKLHIVEVKISSLEPSVPEGDIYF